MCQFRQNVPSVRTARQRAPPRARARSRTSLSQFLVYAEPQPDLTSAANEMSTKGRNHRERKRGTQQQIPETPYQCARARHRSLGGAACQRRLQAHHTTHPTDMRTTTPPACLLGARVAHARRGKCGPRRSIVDIINVCSGPGAGRRCGPTACRKPLVKAARAGRGGSWPAHVPPAQQRALACGRTAPTALSPSGPLQTNAGGAANTILGKPSATPMCRPTSRGRARIGRPQSLTASQVPDHGDTSPAQSLPGRRAAR